MTCTGENLQNFVEKAFKQTLLLFEDFCIYQICLKRVFEKKKLLKISGSRKIWYSELGTACLVQLVWHGTPPGAWDWMQKQLGANLMWRPTWHKFDAFFEVIVCLRNVWSAIFLKWIMSWSKFYASTYMWDKLTQGRCMVHWLIRTLLPLIEAWRVGWVTVIISNSYSWILFEKSDHSNIIFSLKVK